MSDFKETVNWDKDGLLLSVGVQSLNAFGVLFLVYAFRYGKAIIVAPMTTALSPVLTVVISLAIYSVMPHPIIIGGIVLAIIASVLMVIAEIKTADDDKE